MKDPGQIQISYQRDTRSLIGEQLYKLEHKMMKMYPGTYPLYEAFALTLWEMDGVLKEMEEIKKIVSSHTLS